MPLVTLPKSQQDHLHQIQLGMLADVNNAIGEIDVDLKKAVARLIISLARAKFAPNVVRRKLQALFRRHTTLFDKKALKLVQDAAGYAERYMAELAHYGVLARNLAPITPSEVAWYISKKGKERAAATLAFARGAPAGAPQMAFWDRLRLSHEIHKLTGQQLQEATAAVLRAMREASGFGSASRELIRQIPGIGAGQVQPQAVRTLLGKARHLERFSWLGSKDPDIRKVKQYLRRLAAGGRVGSAYAELVQDLERGKLAGKAVEKWIYQKQRYAAERILDTETSAAFRMRQVEVGEKIPWLIGYRWRMNLGVHARFRRTKPGRLKRFGGKACICEVMDGTIVSPEEYRQYWFRGGHPHCACFFEEVFDRERMFSAQETAGEKAWLDRMGL
jgi:hypothetical protein